MLGRPIPVLPPQNGPEVSGLLVRHRDGVEASGVWDGPPVEGDGALHPRADEVREGPAAVVGEGFLVV